MRCTEDDGGEGVGRRRDTSEYGLCTGDARRMGLVYLYASDEPLYEGE